MSIILNGVPLVAGEDASLSPRLAALDLYDLCRQTAPGRLSALGFPWLSREIRPQVGKLLWPRDACRFATAWLVASDAELAGTPAGAYYPLVLGDGVRSVQTSLWLWPPRPLADCGVPGLNLCLLTDCRAFWPDVPASVPFNPTTSWADVFASLGAALGAGVVADPVGHAFLQPPQSLAVQYESAAALLDAAAYAVSMRVVRTLDGTVKVVGPATAAAAFATSLAAASPRIAGGLMKTPALTAAAVPSSVVMAFPIVAGGQSRPGAWSYTANGTGQGQPRLVHSSAAADFTSGNPTPDNQSELSALATAWTAALCGWEAASPDAVFNGVCPWVPSGMEGLVEWTVRPGETATRVQRPPWLERRDDLAHQSSATVPPPGGPTIQRVSLSGPSTVTLWDTTDWLVVTTDLLGASIDLFLSDMRQDRRVVVQNVGPGVLTLNQYAAVTISGVSVVLQVEDSLQLAYDGAWKCVFPDYRALVSTNDLVPGYLSEKIADSPTVVWHIVTALNGSETYVPTAIPQLTDSLSDGTVNVTQVVSQVFDANTMTLQQIGSGAVLIGAKAGTTQTVNVVDITILVNVAPFTLIYNEYNSTLYFYDGTQYCVISLTNCVPASSGSSGSSGSESGWGGCPACPDGAARQFRMSVTGVVEGNPGETIGCTEINHETILTLGYVCTWSSPDQELSGGEHVFWTLTIGYFGVTLILNGPGAEYTADNNNWDCKSPLTLTLSDGFPGEECKCTAEAITIYPV